ncbi:MAG: VWA-like domain-containing protein, partial [Oceanidesulfovibrio sp.]
DEDIRGGAELGPDQEMETQEEAEGGAGAEGEPGSLLNESHDDSSDGDGQEAAAESGEDETPPQDEQGDDPGMSGEVRDAPSDTGGADSAADMTRQEESWQVAVAQALHKAREAGELPGALERLLAEALAPSLSWRELLRRFLANAARNDFSWVRPNRRHLHAGLYLPGLESEELSEVVVAVDVSGSVSQEELDSFAAELSAVLEEFDTTVRVFTCDAALTTQDTLARWDLPLDFTATGGGGTDFRPPFTQLEQDGATPACLVYFTDMECDTFPEDPGFPVLWVTTNARHATPPFGEVVTMEPCP